MTTAISILGKARSIWSLRLSRNRDAAAVAIYHPNVAGINRQGQALAQHQRPGLLMDHVTEAEKTANQAAIPEGDGNDAMAFLLALQPLDQHPHTEDHL